MVEFPTKEANFTFEDIKNCKEAFVTGTFAGIIPVSKSNKELWYRPIKNL